MKTACLVLPNQLFEDHPALKGTGEVILVEHPRFFTEVSFHKQKLMLHRASMKNFADGIDKRRYRVHYIECPAKVPKREKESLFSSILSRYRIESIRICDPVDHRLGHEIEQACTNAGCELVLLDNPGFLNTPRELAEYFPEKQHYSMTSFYIDQRKKRGILLDAKGKALGGKWSLDRENRKPVSEESREPQLPAISQPGIRKAREYVHTHFKDAPGGGENFFYPVDRAGAIELLDHFLENRLELFGDYQDAISSQQRFLFHSLLSSSLNTGLIRPGEVVEKALSYGRNQKIRLNSLEGFIRQVIGWREFMRGAYLFLNDRMTGGENLPGCDRKMPRAFYKGTTGIEPVDHVIRAVLANAYAHHIERLMVLGNFMLLCRIDPVQVYQWFLELFIDAYEWVMVPNVYAMSQYCAGGLITTKPYVSSSNYISKMSDYPPGSWCPAWDGLYWSFLHDHRKRFAGNPRMKYSSIGLERLSDSKLSEHLENARIFLAGLK